VIQGNEGHFAQVLAEPIDHRIGIAMNDDFYVGKGSREPSLHGRGSTSIILQNCDEIAHVRNNSG